MGDLSKHFSRSEFACPCCGEAPMSKLLIDGLEELRKRLRDRFCTGIVVLVTRGGGYRCQSYNEGIRKCPSCSRTMHQRPPYTCGHCNVETVQRSAKNSWHLKGGAADIKGMFVRSQTLVPAYVVQREAREVDRFRKGGIGSAQSYTHVDIGSERRWKY